MKGMENLLLEGQASVCMSWGNGVLVVLTGFHRILFVSFVQGHKKMFVCSGHTMWLCTLVQVILFI